MQKLFLEKKEAKNLKKMKYEIKKLRKSDFFFAQLTRWKQVHRSYVPIRLLGHLEFFSSLQKCCVQMKEEIPD